MGIGAQPRYEFRAWGSQLADVSAALGSLSEDVETRESVETYLVARGEVRANPKVRWGALDVKALVEVRDGFELWAPKLEALFPVGADVAADVLFGWLGVQPFDLVRPRYTLPQLLDDVVQPCDEVTAVEVSKIRRAYVIDGCRAEIADVVIAGTELQTAAVESTEIPLLRRARRTLHLDDWSNTCYPTAIKRVVGW
jgi:hypothetical protein